MVLKAEGKSGSLLFLLRKSCNESIAMNGIIRGYMPHTTQSRVTNVALGSWDALESVLALREHGRWEAMLGWLLENGLTGMNLSAAIAEFGGDTWAFADWVRAQMTRKPNYEPMTELPDGMMPALTFRTL